MKKLLLVLLSFYCASVLIAAEITNLYEAEVPVASQSPQDRQAAMAGAMQTVLIKVTGNAGSVRQPAARALISGASNYVQQYRYRVAEPVDGETQGQRYVNVIFDAQAVNQKLRAAGLPVWGKSRPQVIAWVGIAENRQRRLLSPDFDAGLSTLLQQYADIRGIPYLMPLMDLEDQAAISSSDLWGAFEGPLRNASARYMADMILAVRLDQVSADYWRSSWTMLNRNDEITWEFNGNNLNTLLQEGMNKMADLVAGAYAPVGGSELQALTIQVEGVDSFAQLTGLQQMLSALEPVSSLNIRHLQGHQVLIDLLLRGGQAAFTQAVELTGKLELLPKEVVTPEVDMPVIQLSQSAGSAVDLQPEMEPVPVGIDLLYRLR